MTKINYNRTARKRMSSIRLISWFIALCFLIWLLFSWYLGSKSELAFREFIQSKSEIIGEEILHIELLDYKSTLFGGNASLRLTSDLAYLDEQFGDVLIKATQLNGPIFILEKGVRVGSSRWRLEVDETRLSNESSQSLKALFPNSLPRFIVTTDFQQKAHYQTQIETSFFKALITGIYTFETDQREEFNRGVITLEDLDISNTDLDVKADKVAISFQHQKALTAQYKPGTTSIDIPRLQISGQSLPSEPIHIKVKIRSDLSITGDSLKGYINLELQSKGKIEEAPFEDAQLSVSFNGLSAEGIMEVSDAKAKLDNLKQQLTWTIEDASAYPEGRDEIRTLNGKIGDAKISLNEKLSTDIFISRDSLLRVEMNSHHRGADSTLKIFVEGGDSSVSTESVASLMNGKLEMDLNDHFYRYIKSVFKHYESLEELGFNKKFKLELKKGKLSHQSEN